METVNGAFTIESADALVVGQAFAKWIETMKLAGHDIKFFRYDIHTSEKQVRNQDLPAAKTK